MIKTIEKNLKNNIALQLLVLLLITLFLGEHLPVSVQNFFYSISLTLNNLLLFVLPAIIFICLYTSLSSIKSGKGFWFILVIMVIVLASNLFSTLIAYGVGSLKLIHTMPFSNFELNRSLIPLWKIQFPKWVSNATVLVLGLGVGIFCSFFQTKHIHKINHYLRASFVWFFSKVFIRMLPLILFGYILNMQHRGILTQSIKSCLSLIILISLIYMVYLSFLFLILAKFNLKQCFLYIKNTLPAAFTGFSTMSSFATMPVTLNSAEKNTGNSNVGLFVIPATVNIHLIGLAISIPLMALTLLTNFGMECPPLGTYLKFALSFIVAQFAITPTPASGIFIMIPLLETYLGFTGEMSTLIIGLYILTDPIETSANIVGNSILTIFISKLFPSFGENSGKDNGNGDNKDSVMES